MSTATIPERIKPSSAPLSTTLPPKSQIIALQKKDDLESFAIKRGESEQDQSPLQMLLGNSAAVSIREQRFAAAIVRANPAAPVNFVKEPIHDHEQDDNGEQPSRSLQIQSGHAFRQLADDSDGD